MEQHHQGTWPDGYTAKRRPVQLIYCMYFPDGTHDQAIAWEKKLKKWSRQKKEVVINGKWDDLPSLSECKNLTHYKYAPQRIELDQLKDPYPDNEGRSVN
jgi:putative endonuclease